MWHCVLQYIGISISYEVLHGRRIEAGGRKLLCNIPTSCLGYITYHHPEE
jgi:hypothetical protein